MENKVRAKKHLGQHFLKDENIARKIVDSLTHKELYNKVLEIGPGMGVLTKYLIADTSFTTYAIDIDRESIAYLKAKYPQLKDRIIEGDFLKLAPSPTPSTGSGQVLPRRGESTHTLPDGPFAIIGNFPYNISTQILFKVLENKEQVPELVGMFQKEVAQRIASKHGNKQYGILSVLLQAFYDIKYLFTVHEHVFSPAPKVKSAVIQLTRNSVKHIGCDEKLFFDVVKTAFNQRRKMLRNGLSKFNMPENKFLTLRAEQLTVADFIELTKLIEISI